MQIVWLILVAVAGYALGCFSLALYLSTHVGKFDIRSRGSGNAGTTNMLREMGWRYGIMTFAWDFLKGLLPTLAAIWLLGYPGGYAVGAGVILGHAFPVTRKFRGGKCVATCGGVFIALYPSLTVPIGLLMIIVMFITRMVSLSVLITYSCYALLLFFVPTPDPAMRWFVVAAVLLVIFLHRENIVRICHGQEKRLTVKKNRKAS